MNRGATARLVSGDLDSRILSVICKSSLLLLLATSCYACSRSEQTTDETLDAGEKNTGGKTNSSGGAGSGSGGATSDMVAVMATTGGSSDASGGDGATGGDAITGGAMGNTGGDNDSGIDPCSNQAIEAAVQRIESPTNLLFIHDRSSSMTENWGSSTKYESAADAVIQAVSSQASLLKHVGSVFFPGSETPLICHDGSSTCNPSDAVDSNMVAGCCHAPMPAGDGMIGGGCYVSPIAAPDQIPFTDPSTFLSSFSTLASPGSNVYFTPLEAATVRGNEAILDAQADGTLLIPGQGDSLAVIIVTDGVPNCGINIDNVLAQVGMWSSLDFKTYVVGLPGSDTTNGAMDNLNNLAVAGGTMQYIEATDPSILEQTVTDIVLAGIQEGIASCDIALSPAAATPDELRLVVTLQDGSDAAFERVAGNPNSFTVSSDGTKLTLHGSLCAAAKAGTYLGYRVDFGCTTLPPAPSP